MKRFVYKTEKYTSEYYLRQAIFKYERLVFGELTSEFMKEHEITEEEYNPEDEMSDEELAQRVRNRRNSLISQSDFYVQSDYPSTPEGLEAVKAYRQALRDIPSQKGFPRNIQWPEVPVVLMRGKDKVLGLAKTSGLAKVGIYYA